MENVSYDLKAIQNHLLPTEGNHTNDDRTNLNSGDSSISIVSLNSRKRVRSTSSKPPLERKYKKKSKNVQEDKSIKDYCVDNIYFQTKFQTKPE